MPDNNVEYYFLFLAFLAFAVLISMRLRDSRVGWAWQAIREDELAAQAMGINVFVAKLQAFAIGASFAGVAGCLLASWQHSVFPANFMFTESINILAMVILGGMGNLFGVILGAALIVALPELFREFEQYRLLAFGLMLMVLMVFRPQGLLTFRGRRQAVPAKMPEPMPDAVPARVRRAAFGSLREDQIAATAVGHPNRRRRQAGPRAPAGVGGPEIVRVFAGDGWTRWAWRGSSAGMSKTFRAWDVDQVWLLPPSVHDFVPAGHPAHLVRELVRSELDLSAILAATSGRSGASRRITRR